MIFNKTAIEGAYIIEPEKIEDERGFFARGFCQNEFADHNISFTPVQENIGFSKRKYTLRGLHYQHQPYGEQKFIRCMKGAMYDVVVDVRPDSPSYKQWIGVELSADNYTMLFVPKGCANGYQTLEMNTEVFYMVSAFYTPEAEQGIRWNDPEFGIEWKEMEDIIISEKDRNWSDFDKQNV